MTTGIAPAETITTKRAHIGSFDVVERLKMPDQPDGQVTLRVQGTEPGSQAGKSGIASCFAAPKDEEAVARMQERLTRLRTIDHPALDPVLECGASGSIIYWVRATSAAETLTTFAARAALAYHRIAAIISQLAAGLQVAHNAGLAHGEINTDDVRLASDGSVSLTGLGIYGRGPAQDQHHLGMLAVELLAGKPWIEPDLGEHPHVEQRIVRAQHLREWLSSSTERIATVLNRATEPDPVNRFGSIEEFANEFSREVRFSADDLAHGAFEAISSRNIELAMLLTDKARLYDPNCEALAILNVQLHGGSVFDSAQQTLAANPGFSINVTMGTIPVPGFPKLESSPATMAPLVPSKNVLSPELTAGLPPEFLESIVAQFEAKPDKKTMNSVFVLILAGLGMIIFMLILALVMFSMKDN